MKTELINLSSTYTYIRCDSEFELLFTNGQTMPMWRGFYCFRTEQLQEYNTNGQLIIQSSDDNCNMWWLCTNTLIMSVTDINNEALNGIGQLVSGISEIAYSNALANLNQLTYGDRTNNLLESIQNSFSIFLNAYVEANNVQDFGYITGTINNDFNCTVYIAKANKYNFNCGITFERNFNSNPEIVTVDSFEVQLIKFANSSLFNISTSFSTSSPYSVNFNVSLKKSNVNFTLYNNLNEIQTGYAISNVSSTSKLIVPSGNFAIARPNNAPAASSFTYDGFTLNNIISVSHSSSFSLSMGSQSISRPNTSRTVSTKFNMPSYQITEKLSINFDVSKT